MGKAFLAGVVGGTATTILGAIVRAMGMPVNLEETLGSMVTGTLGPSAFNIGLTMHLVISGLIALLYAIGFEYGTRRADVRTGVAFSLVHTVIAGVFVALMPVMHPLMPSELAAPGPFMVNLGLIGVTVFILLHVVYGAVVGAIYGPVEGQLIEEIDPIDEPELL